MEYLEQQRSDCNDKKGKVARLESQKMTLLCQPGACRNLKAKEGEGGAEGEAGGGGGEGEGGRGQGCGIGPER